MLFLLTLALPAFAAGWIAWREFPRRWDAWKPHVVTIALVAAAGFYTARPFLKGTWVGTGESYNYSLSLADAVTQFRAGHFPVFVGETEFAFNGRIHPLRTAPYYCYAAGWLDLVTFRQLDFWQLQDLLILLSIVGGGFSAYVSLRYLAGHSRFTARAGAVIFVLSPAVFSVTYSMDLYMTVTTLPFLPLAIGACLLTFRERSLAAYLLLGTAGALVWLAHPPIALWVSSVVIALQAAVWLTRRPTPRAAVNAAAGVVAGGALAGFGFVSTLVMQEASSIGGSHDYTPLFDSLRNNFRAAFLPASAAADKLGDFQLGYVFWTLFAASAIVLAWKRRGPALALVALAGGLLLLLTPVPGLMPWLWNHLPPVFPNLTNIWPMQRLYLVASALILFAAAAAWAEFEPRVVALDGLPRKAFNGLQLAVLALMLWQAQPYLNRGFLLRRTTTASELVHRSENVDLTVTSYAMFTLPPRFIHGVADAEREFRLLDKADQAEIANNWTAASPGTVRARGTFNVVGFNPVQLTLSGVLRLQPGRRYVLDLDFQMPPFNGTLLIEGEKFERRYFLPSAGEPRAFGMQPGNSHSLFLWTTNPAGTELKLRVATPPGPRAAAASFATYVLSEIIPANYPVQVEQWSPLRGRVNAPRDAWLETPRRFLRGYAGAVDGKPVAVAASSDGLLLVPVPAGSHSFEVSYPGPPALRAAFWTSLLSLGALLALGIGWLIRRRRSDRERPTPNVQRPTPNPI